MVKKIKLLLLLFVILLPVHALNALNILFIIEKFPWHTKAIMFNQMKGLLDRGHNVQVFTYRGLSPAEVDREYLEYKIFDRIHYGKMPALENFDVIVCQYGYLGKEFIKLKKILSSKKPKFVTFFRGGDITTDKHMEFGGYDELLKESDLLMPICKYFKHKLILLGCDPKKIVVHYSPINCKRFNYVKFKSRSNEKIRIISVNRLEEEKAVDIVIKAVKKVLLEYKNFEYIIVGDGKLRKTLEELIQANGMGDYIRLVGWKTQEEIKTLLSHSHLLVLASVTPFRGNQEAIPNVIKEAMLMHVPVITTFHGGIEELIEDNITGFLVPERSVDAIASKILYVIKNYNALEQLTEKAAEKTHAMFDMEKLCDELSAIFEKLVSNNEVI